MTENLFTGTLNNNKKNDSNYKLQRLQIDIKQRECAVNQFRTSLVNRWPFSNLKHSENDLPQAPMCACITNWYFLFLQNHRNFLLLAEGIKISWLKTRTASKTRWNPFFSIYKPGPFKKMQLNVWVCWFMWRRKKVLKIRRVKSKYDLYKCLCN